MNCKFHPTGKFTRYCTKCGVEICSECVVGQFDYIKNEKLCYECRLEENQNQLDFEKSCQRDGLISCIIATIAWVVGLYLVGNEVEWTILLVLGASIYLSASNIDGCFFVILLSVVGIFFLPILSIIYIVRNVIKVKVAKKRVEIMDYEILDFWKKQGCKTQNEIHAAKDNANLERLERIRQREIIEAEEQRKQDNLNKALLYAVQSNDMERMKELMDNGANPFTEVKFSSSKVSAINYARYWIKNETLADFLERY